MARLPDIRRLLREDFKEAPGWIEKLLGPLNSFFDTVHEALSRNITFEENVSCQIKEMEFTTESDYSTAVPTIDGWGSLQFKSTLSKKAKGVFVMQIYEQADDYRPLTNAVSLDWLDLDGSIVIKYVSGLANSTDYFIRFLVI